jgi:ligand-binding SRPBCC domain-containing protein
MKQAHQKVSDTSITVSQEREAKFGRIWKLVAVQHLPKPVESVFPFFSDAYNLERLTPSSLKFNVLTPKPIEMRSGCEIKYKLKIHGFPIKWKTTILDFDPPYQFVDNQDSGPYALWHHTHTFEQTADGSGTICTDTVRYRPAGWILAPMINKFFVQKDVTNIFRYRFKQLDDIFSPVAGS